MTDINTSTSKEWAQTWMTQQLEIMADLPACYKDDHESYIADAVVGGLPWNSKQHDEVVELIKHDDRYGQLADFGDCGAGLIANLEFDIEAFDAAN